MDLVREAEVLMNALRALASFLVGLEGRHVPDVVRRHCGTLTADSVACALGAFRTAEGRRIARAFQRDTPYRIFVTADALAGVHIDAMLGNLLDFDDVYEGSGHVGCMIIPPALRLGAMLGATNDDVVAAIAGGFEVAARFLDASRPSEAARAQIWGIGSRLAPATAAVVARLLGLNAEAAAHALALACATAPVASVRKTVYGGSGVTWVKNNFGIAATAGVAAAFMAAEGARGPLDILEGPDGFARMIGTDGWIPDVLTQGLGTTWLLPRIGLKPYPCCRHAHGVIDAAQQGLRDLGVPATAVDEIIVAGPVWIHGVPFTHLAPTTMHDAQYSIPYCVAVALLGIEPGVAWFEPATLARADVRSLASTVRIEPQPRGGAGGRVRLAAAGRATTVEVTVPRGSPALPLSGAEQRAKYMTLVRGLMDERRAGRTFDELKALRFDPDSRALVDALPAIDFQAGDPPRVFARSPRGGLPLR